MKWPGDLATAGWTGHDGPLRMCLSWLGGFSAEATLEGEHLSEREVRRIRAQQVDAVSRLTPITMIVNLVNVAIVLGMLWDSGSNGFLTLWALVVLSAALLASRAWLRARRIRPKEASARATRRLVVQAFLLAAIWGSLPIAVLGGLEPMYQMIIACLMAGMIAGGAFTLSTFPRAGLTYMWMMTPASALALFGVTSAVGEGSTFRFSLSLPWSDKAVSDHRAGADDLKARIAALGR